jgi:hypothetical protein
VYIIDRAVPSGNKADDCNDCAWFSPLFESEIEGAVKHDTREIPDEDAKSISYGTMVCLILQNFPVPAIEISENPFVSPKPYPDMLC